MRQIGSLPDQSQAERFADYLLSKGIATQVEASDETWVVWVRDEDRLEESKRELGEFVSNPADTRYRAAANEAAQIRRNSQLKSRERARNTVDVRRDLWSQPSARQTPVTMAMAICCIVVAILTGIGGNQRTTAYRALAFRDPAIRIPIGPSGRVAVQDMSNPFYDILHGQLWRLITPIFLHYGLPHIAFNLLWLFSLGGMIETRKSSGSLMAVTLAAALAGNIGQALWSGSSFGGMSGVVYGLLGYVWIRSRLFPADGLQISSETLIIMLLWLALGLSGLLEVAIGVRIANAAHLFGLIAGVAVAYLEPARRLERSA